MTDPSDGNRASTRRKLLTATALGLASLTAGCSDWGRSDSEKNPQLAPEWTFSANDRSLTRPAVADGRVFVGCRDKRLYALDAASGAEQWHYETGGSVEAEPVVGDGQVFAVSEDGDLYALDAATGRQNWVLDTYRNVDNRPVLSPERAYVSFWKAILVGVDRETGERRFRRETTDHLATPAVAGNVLYYDAPGEGVYAINAETGERRWKYAVDHSTGVQPTISGGTVFVGGSTSRDNWSYAHLLALDRATGEKRWEFETKGGDASEPLVADGRVYVAYNSHVRAFDDATGETIWHRSFHDSGIHFDINGPPALDDATLYVAGGQLASESPARLVALDAETGTPKWQFRHGDYFRSPVAADGTLYVTDAQAKVLYTIPAHPDEAPTFTTVSPT